MQRLNAIQVVTGGSTPGGVRVLAQALQFFDDRPPRNRKEFAVARKLAQQMRCLIRLPSSAAHIFRLSAEFPVVEALIDEFLLNAQILLSRERSCVVLNGLMQRLQQI